MKKNPTSNETSARKGKAVLKGYNEIFSGKPVPSKQAELTQFPPLPKEKTDKEWCEVFKKSFEERIREIGSRKIGAIEQAALETISFFNIDESFQNLKPVKKNQIWHLIQDEIPDVRSFLIFFCSLPRRS